MSLAAVTFETSNGTSRARVRQVLAPAAIELVDGVGDGEEPSRVAGHGGSGPSRGFGSAQVVDARALGMFARARSLLYVSVRTSKIHPVRLDLITGLMRSKIRR